MRILPFPTLPELWRQVRESWKVSLLLFLLVLLLLGAVIVLTESSAVMPFIYSIF